MNDDELIKSLETATSLLCERYKSLKAENARLRERNKALESESRGSLEAQQRFLSQIETLQIELTQRASQLRSWLDEQKKNQDRFEDGRAHNKAFEAKQ
jgi:hypothetical protein